ncbi:MAG: heavy metal translocating P-type ATPase [Planctomycetia bacterium]|nr:heavy metal translocating P-type ATPase [Planctomycetia bacterium]
MQKKYTITGMRCAGCAANVERTVSQIAGVTAVQVSLASHRMLVSYQSPDPSEEIVRRVSTLGFSAQELISPIEERQRVLEQEVKESHALRDRLRLSLLFLLPILLLAWTPLPTSLHEVASLTAFLLASFIIAINRVIFLRGFRNLVKAMPDMDSLVAIGASASYLYSVWLLLALLLGLNLPEPIETTGICFESSAMILTLITLGRYLESRVRSRTTHAIDELLDLMPDTAVVRRDGQEREIPADELLVGDLVLVRPGRKIPADGLVLAGSSLVDQAFLTGESIPVAKSAGDSVFSGTVNHNGYLEVSVQKTGSETTLAAIIELVQSALGSKAPIARLADRLCARFVPLVLLIAFVTGAVHLFLGDSGFQTLSAVIAVLVISCPCALGLATPLAVAAGTGRAALDGILVKSAQAFELLNRAKIILFDKTGTVTQGKPQLTEVIATAQETTRDLVALAAALETRSDHPAAQALRSYAQEHKIPVVPDIAAQEKPGQGLFASFEGHDYRIGNRHAAEDAGIDLTPWHNRIEEKLKRGAIVLFLIRDKTLLGILVFTDRVKQDSRLAIDRLKRMGLDVILLSGDSHKTTAAVAEELKIEHVIAEVLPADKEQTVHQFKSQGTVVMVGDGINDAPALAHADVGIALASGANIAIDSAEVIITGNNVQAVVTALLLARRTVRIIKENLFWAFIYNILGIPLAAGVFVPICGWRLNPVFAAAAMGMSSLCVVLNSLRNLRPIRSQGEKPGTK